MDYDDGKDSSMSKVYGIALYTEFRRADNTAQMIITSEAVDPDTKKIVPATVITRNISLAHQRKTWKIKVLRSGVTRDIDPSTGRIASNKSVDMAQKIAKENLEQIHRYYDGFRVGNWTFYKEPLFVEMSSDDVHAVAASLTPDALIRRVLRAREVAGFSASLFNDN